MPPKRTPLVKPAAMVKLPPMSSVRHTIAAEVHKLVGTGTREAGAGRPSGDAGLMGPDGVAWRVHGDFTTMMTGGVAALLMQMLHPHALAGVWDHSNFRGDMLGRLRRTAQFIAGTTYGSTAEATRLIDTINRIHARVHGALPDGTAYSATDPAVLTWVHVAGASSFLAAYRRYREPGLSRAAQDRYYAEVAEVARRLGATNVPGSARAIEAYLRAMRPQLRVDARTRDVAAALLSQSAALPSAMLGELMLQSGIDLLPPWAGDLHGLRVPLHKKPLIRAGTQGIGGVLRWALAAPPQPDGAAAG